MLRMRCTRLLVALLCFGQFMPSAFAAPTITTLVSGIDSAGAYVSAGIGGDGFPIMAYQGADGDIGIDVYHCSNAACTAGGRTRVETLIDPGIGLALAVGSDGFGAVTYDTHGGMSITHCSNAACSSFVTNGLGANPESTLDIMIGADGFPGTSHIECTDDHNLYFTDCSNASCASNSPQIVVTPGSCTDTAAVKIGSNPAIVYDDGAVKLFACTNATCSTGGSQTIHASTGGFYSMAVGADGHPVIAIGNGTTLRLADCSTANCSSVTVTTIASDLVSGGAQSVDVALGDDDLPIVSYYGASNDLRVVHCGNAACSASNTTSTVDSTGNMGVYTSIVIGTDGMPGIAYHDGTNSTLKFADCDNVRCDGSGPDPVPFIPWWAMGPMVLAAGFVLWNKGRLQESDLRLQ